MAPPEPSLLLFTHGTNELLDRPRTAVLSADGERYRTIPGAWAGYSVLSFDGRRVALGSLEGDGRLRLRDLTTGRQRQVRFAEGTCVLPRAWSVDGESLFVATTPRDQSESGWVCPVSGGASVWSLWRVDLAQGNDPTLHPLDRDVRGPLKVAPLPDGSGILLSTSTTQLRSPDGTRTMTEDTGVAGGLLASSVSPGVGRVMTTLGNNGDTLSTTGTTTIRELGAGTDRPSWTVSVPRGTRMKPQLLQGLGWIDDDHLLMAGWDNDTGVVRLHLYSVDVSRPEVYSQGDSWGGRVDEISVEEIGAMRGGMSDVSVAPGLLAHPGED